MATWDDVRAIASSLPETTEVEKRGLPHWLVRDKGFAWERPLRKADLEALGDAAPDGDILGVSVPDVIAKEALVADDPDVYFTTPHFDGYPAVLVRLATIPLDELEEVLVEAWFTKAPKKLAEQFTADTS